MLAYFAPILSDLIIGKDSLADVLLYPFLLICKIYHPGGAESVAFCAVHGSLWGIPLLGIIIGIIIVRIKHGKK